MIDNLALGLTHALMLLAAFLLLKRPDLDKEGPVDPKTPLRKPAADREPPRA